jgi:hypothetical protein
VVTILSERISPIRNFFSIDEDQIKFLLPNKAWQITPQAYTGQYNLVPARLAVASHEMFPAIFDPRASVF